MFGLPACARCRLSEHANPAVDPDNFWALFADLDDTAANGEHTQLQQESYSFPFEYGSRSGLEYRSEQTGRLDCPADYLTFRAAQ